MKHDFFDIALALSLGKKKKSALFLVLLTLSFSFIVAMMSVSGSLSATGREAEFDTFGEWKLAVSSRTYEEKDLKDQSWIEDTGILTVFSEGGVTLGSCDEGMIRMGRFRLISGEYPEEADEIVMEQDALSELGYSYELGQIIHLDRDYRLTGILSEYSDLWSPLYGKLTGAENPEAVMPYPEAFVAEEAAGLSNSSKDILYFIKTELSFPEIIKNCPGLKCVKNELAYRAQDSGSYNVLYLAIIMLTTCTAMALIYGIQAGQELKSVRQMRNMGASGKQLFIITCWQSVILSVPAVIGGLVFGSLFVYVCVRAVEKETAVHVKLDLPFGAMAAVFLLWLLMVIFSRALVFYLLNRKKKNQETVGGRKGKQLAVPVLMAVMIVTAVLSALEIRNSLLVMGQIRVQSDYSLNGALKEESMEAVQSLRGIKRVTASYRFVAQVSFDDYEKYRSGDEVLMSQNKRYPDGIGANVVCYREMNPYLQDLFWESGADEQAFWDGKTVFVLVTGEVDRPAKSFPVSMDQTLSLDVFSEGVWSENGPELFEQPKKEESTTVTAGGVFYRNLLIQKDPYWWSFGVHPVTVIASGTLADRLIQPLSEAGYMTGHYAPDPDIRYTDATLYADDTADFFMTDAEIAKICDTAGLSLINSREVNKKEKGLLEEKLLMLVILSLSVTVLSFLLFGFLLYYRYYFRRRSYALRRCIGMSQKSVRKELAKEYIVFSVSAVFFSALLYAARLLYGYGRLLKIDGKSGLFKSICGIHTEYFSGMGSICLAIFCGGILWCLLGVICFVASDQIFEGSIIELLKSERDQYE